MSTHPHGSLAYRATATIAAVVAAALFLSAGAALAQGPDPDRFIVKFTASGKSDAARRAIASAGGQVLLELPSVNAAAARIPPQALQGLRSNPNIELIEQDSPRFPMAQETPYGIPMVQADKVVEASGNVMVCVIDSGFDAAHEDFLNANVSGTDVAKSGGGTNYWNTDTCGHGTHVAGTIMAQDNEIGVVGVTPGVKIHIVKVFDGEECGWTYASNTINAANACATAGANAGAKVVINMSLGCVDTGRGGRFGCANSTENSGFQTLYDNGVLSVASAGNAGTTQKSYPASYASVISVAAIDENKVVADFSQKNDAVEVSGPGVAVLSTVPTGMGSVAAVTVNNAPYNAEGMDGSPEGDVQNLDIVNCGRATAPCAASGGEICLIERGDISFADKVLNCRSGGGSAAIIYNNEPGMLFGTLGGVGTTIPSVGISQLDGQAILGISGARSGSVKVSATNYASYSGTSMASPHVAGVAALVWGHNASWTNAEIRAALQASAEDLGASGRDNEYGYGLVRAQAALSTLTGQPPEEPPPEEPPPEEPPPEEPGVVTASVQSIELVETKRGPNTRATATVTIVDQLGVALGGASVTGCFDGATTGCATGTTNGSGQASFTSGNYRSGSVSFCVTDVSGPNIKFDNTNACTP